MGLSLPALRRGGGRNCLQRGGRILIEGCSGLRRGFFFLPALSKFLGHQGLNMAREQSETLDKLSPLVPWWLPGESPTQGSQFGFGPAGPSEWSTQLLPPSMVSRPSKWAREEGSSPSWPSGTEQPVSRSHRLL